MKLVAPAFLLLCVATSGCQSRRGVDEQQLQIGQQAVFCSIGTGSGEAPAPGDSSIWCQQAYGECSDGHEYEAKCDSTVGSGTASCSCFVDGVATDEVFTVDDECPIEGDLVLSACGWSP